jgi:hypothetical protein
MKKLIFAAAAVAGMGAFALESANVVGYQNQSIGQFNITATPFVQVNGGEAWTLGDIKPNANWIEMSDVIQTFTSAGKADVAYMYITEATATDAGVEPGWYDSLDEMAERPMNNVPVPFTAGYVAKSGAAGAALTFSGSVKDALTEIPVGGFTITANVTPVNLTLGDIKPNANWIEMSDIIQTFTPAGKADVAYMYITEASAEMFGVEAGWYASDDFMAEKPMNHIPVAAGSGFVAKSGASGATLILPNPRAE